MTSAWTPAERESRISRRTFDDDFDGNGTGGICGKEIALLILRLKNASAFVCKPIRPCGRRTQVIHIIGMSSTVIHNNGNASAAAVTTQGHQRTPAKRQRKRKTRRSGPSYKESRSRIAAQQHRRNGKSIQCPFNVTTYLGHTHLVGLCSSVVFVLRNYARHSGDRKPKPSNVPYLSKLLLFDRKNRKNASSCANRSACLFNHVRLD